MITFTVYYFLDNSNTFTAVNIFTGLALFNQLSVPLLILPVTVLMVIQALQDVESVCSATIIVNIVNGLALRVNEDDCDISRSARTGS